jgi:hypothetical protein
LRSGKQDQCQGVAMPFDQKEEFAARIARIEAGGINTNRTLFVGMGETHALPRGAFAKKKPAPKQIPVIAVLLGGIGVFAATFVALQMMV